MSLISGLLEHQAMFKIPIASDATEYTKDRAENLAVRAIGLADHTRLKVAKSKIYK